MYQLPELQGIPLAIVPLDAMGRARSFPLRGAYEISNDCSNGWVAGQVATNKFPCAGITGLLSYYSPGSTSGLIHQWQVRSEDSLVFRDIPGAYETRLLINQSANMVYRVKDSCVGGGVGYSNEYIVYTRPSGAIGTIIASHNKLDFEFRLSSYTTPSIEWNFGDGTPTITSVASAVVVHSYSKDGHYEVRARAVGGCVDSITRLTVQTFPASVGSMSAQALTIYPNPATTTIRISGRAGATAAVYNMMGQQLISSMLASDLQELSVAQLPAGNYLLRTITKDGATTTATFQKQ
jgi:hypothetical protein